MRITVEILPGGRKNGGLQTSLSVLHIAFHGAIIPTWPDSCPDIRQCFIFIVNFHGRLHTILCAERLINSVFLHQKSSFDLLTVDWVYRCQRVRIRGAPTHLILILIFYGRGNLQGIWDEGILAIVVISYNLMRILIRRIFIGRQCVAFEIICVRWNIFIGVSLMIFDLVLTFAHGHCLANRQCWVLLVLLEQIICLSWLRTLLSRF